jgi:nucleoside-diphosphate-sugar epimerase
MAASNDLVLITGATGFIGIKTLHLALEAGYSVRAAVRNEDKAKIILNAPAIKSLKADDSLTFVTVPDILAPNAYDEAVKGVTYILHVASPIVKGEALTPEQFESELVEPAIKGTTGILESALKEPGIKKIVITSSEVAIIPWEEFVAKEVDTVFDDQYQIPEPLGPYKSSFEAYCASKVRALHASKAFVAKNKPEWGVVNIMPAFVLGENEIANKAEDLLLGTNAVALAPILGNASGWGAVPSTSVHVEDVAKLHVLALDPKIPGSESFLAISEGEKGTKWDEYQDIVKRNFPEAVAKGVLPNNGPALTKRTKVDASRTEKVFGIKFLSYEEQVKSLVKQCLSLIGFEA